MRSLLAAPMEVRWFCVQVSLKKKNTPNCVLCLSVIFLPGGLFVSINTTRRADIKLSFLAKGNVQEHVDPGSLVANIPTGLQQGKW